MQKFSGFMKQNSNPFLLWLPWGAKPAYASHPFQGDKK
jgi:hypothetical protein